MLGLLISVSAQAQEDVYRIEHTEIFVKLRRPMVLFDHQTHVDALEEQGCGVCHHSPDPGTGQAVYIEGEEDSCTACHDENAEDNVPALREAYHGSCTQCHREMAEGLRMPPGPTTCGECHRPEIRK